MTLHIFNNKEKQEILKSLSEQFGISEIPGLIIRIGQERLFLFQGSFTEKEIKALEEDRIPIERAGVYFAKVQGEGMRLSIEGIHLLKNQITKNIFEIGNEKDLETWMHGSELPIALGKRGFVVMKYSNDFVGSGKASDNKITNFIPKSRRLKYRGS